MFPYLTACNLLLVVLILIVGEGGGKQHKREYDDWAIMNSDLTGPRPCPTHDESHCEVKFCENGDAARVGCEPVEYSRRVGACACRITNSNGNFYFSKIDEEECQEVGRLGYQSDADNEDKTSCNYLCWGAIGVRGPNRDNNYKGSIAFQCNGSGFCYCQLMYLEKSRNFEG